MALVKLLFSVVGTAPAELTATPIDTLPLSLGSDPGTVRFSVVNTLSRDVVLASADATLSGPGAAKATAALDTALPLTITPGSSAELSVTVTPTEPITEGETIDVSVVVTE